MCAAFVLESLETLFLFFVLMFCLLFMILSLCVFISTPDIYIASDDFARNGVSHFT